MELRVLGPVEVLDDHGEPVELPGVKAKTVLATLVLAGGRTVSDARLSSMLWSWHPPSTMTAQIYIHVSRLRKRLGPAVDLVRRPRGYHLVTEDTSLDLADFEWLAARGREALAQRRYQQAAEHLRSALAHFRGTTLSNVTEYLVEAERPRLDELRLAAMEDWVEAELALGRHHPLVPELTALVAEHPMREKLRAQLMTALFRCDRQSDALALFHTGRRVLAEELGIDPGTTLTGVYQAALAGTLGASGGSAGLRPAAAPGAPAAAMLPADLADFTGRAAQLHHLLQLAEPAGDRVPRRALITGMAGTGKSALAVHAAHLLRERFPDGQLYADLSKGDGGMQELSAVLACFLRALGVEPGDAEEDPLDLVRLYRTHTAGRRLLLVLDNAVSNSQIAPLLPGGPQSAVIVTSWRHLSFASEADCLELGPFSHREARDLLAAVAGQDRIAADPAAARQITDSCARLPLAVRIAGVRLAARPQWTAARLAARLAPRQTRLGELSFDELRVRDTLRRPLRQVSLRGRQVLPRLAVFGTTAFPVEAAAQALRLPETTTEQVLEELADLRLLELVDLAEPGAGGYRMHELVLLTTGADGGHRLAGGSRFTPDSLVG